jgi:hypothetical protein
MAEFKYEIVKELGVISEGARGWTKELNLVSWNDKPPKYDIRDWAPDHEKMGKGVKFERIRRITGYLVGTLDKWNDAKKAEEKDRVKHGLKKEE